MRVLYLTINANRASTTVPTEGWLKYLRPRGLEPVVVTDKAGPFRTWSEAEGIPTYQVPLPFPRRRWPWPFLSSALRLGRIARRHGIQLVHCNEQETYPIGQFLAKRLQLPAVVSVQFTLTREFCEWAFREGRQPRRVFFTSNGSTEACRRAVAGLVPESDWRLLYNGVDLARFYPDPALGEAFRVRHGLGDARLVGNACYIQQRKQVEHLFQATSRLDVPGLKILLAGGPADGETDYSRQLIREGHALLGDRFVHIGHLDDLSGFYNALDLFVNTSREEGCSLSISEALASGCPVVSYTSTSASEQVQPNGGEIVEQDHVERLTEALRTWLSDPAMLTAARRAARQRAEESLDIRTLAEKLWDEYDTVLAATPKSLVGVLGQ